MRALFDLFLDICLLRKGPQDLPASWSLLKLSLGAYGLTSLLAQAVEVEPLLALVQALVDTAMLTGLSYGVLRWTGHGERFVQTLTALAGVGALLGAVVLPLLIWMSRAVAIGADASLAVLFFLIWLSWSIAVVVHILRHALSTTLPVAALYTLGYLAISWLVASRLFPHTI
jgi:hypothetical protein